MADPTPIIIARFWERLEKRGPEECWLWQGTLRSNGYGILCERPGGRKGKLICHAPHRIAAFLRFGPMPEGAVVCHTCDNRRCCNPAHLFVGTHVDNQADKVAKNRQAKGELSGPSKLTEAQAKEIRAAYNNRTHREWGAREFAARFGVNETTIAKVAWNVTWRHLE